MAKTLVKTTQELVNFAHQYRIETEGKSIQEIGKELTDKLMSYYDKYYMYIDNGKQMREAELKNREIEEEVAAIKKVLETTENNKSKEESTMSIKVKVKTKHMYTGESSDIIAGPFESIEKATEVAERFASLQSSLYVVILEGDNRQTIIKESKEVVLTETERKALEDEIQLHQGECNYCIKSYDEESHKECKDCMTNIDWKPIDAELLVELKEDGVITESATYTCATCRWNGQNCLSCQSCGEDGISSWEPIVETEKEESPMTENKATTNNNTVQEEVTMKTKTTFAERILNMGRIDRILYVYDALRTATKNTDEAFIKKDDLAKFMFDNDLIGRQLSKTEVNRTKRDELVELFNTAVDNLIKNGVIKPLNTVAVEDTEDATAAIEKAQLELAKQACEEAVGHSVGTMEFYLAVLRMYNDVQEARKQAAIEIDNAKINTVNETPKAEPKTENKPAMPISQANVVKESEVLPNTVAETVSTEFSTTDRHIFYGTNRMNGLLYYAARNTENKHIVSAYMVFSVSLEYVSGKSFNKWKEILEADKEGKYKESYKAALEKATKLRDEIVRKYLTVYSKCGDSIKSYSINNLEVYKYSNGKLEQHYLAFVPGGEFVYLTTNEKGYLKANKKAMTPENMEKMKRTCSLVAFGGNQ